MYSPATIESVRSLILEHDKVWFDGKTTLRTLMYHHSKLINRLNNAEQNNANLPPKVRQNMMGKP